MFSIIIPIYNKAPHLRRSIDSVLDQTYSFFELILVNDGSTDESLSIAESYSDERIRIFNRETPGAGGYAARNLGIKKARFDWVAFLDADDEWDKSRLKTLVKLIETFPDATMLSSGWWEFYNDIKINLDDYSQKYLNRSSHYFDVYTLLLDKQPLCTSVAVVKKKLLLEVNGFDETWKRGADLELWLRLLLSGGKGAWHSERTAVYYKNATNMVTLNNTFVDSPVFPTIKVALKKNKNRTLKIALINFNNRINYGVTKSLLLKGKKYRPYFFKNFIFDARGLNKVAVASLFLFFLPRAVAVQLIRKKIL